jgi:hypothetical protein
MKSSKNMRWLAILSWSLIALPFLTFFLTDLRLDFKQLQAPCEGEECNYLAISQDEIDVLVSWGLSARTYSILMNGATVLGVAFSWLLGVVILWFQGASRASWFVSLAMIVIPITLISDADNLATSYPNWFIPSVVLSELGSMILLLLFYLFPSGRFYPRWAFVPLITTYLFLTMISVGRSGLVNLHTWVIQIDFMVLTGLLFLAMGFQILRYRRVSSTIERQQTKWVLLGLFILILGFPTWFLFFGGIVDIPAGLPRLLASIFGWLTCIAIVTTLPVTIAMAILRYRLWDIDVVIRRTLQYSIVSVVLGLVYFSAVTLLQSIFIAASGQSSAVVVVLSTLAIAALFSPLLRRVQETIDRWFYRRKYNADQALAVFAAAARSETDLEQLSAKLTGTVQETLQPAQVSLWLHGRTTQAETNRES